MNNNTLFTAGILSFIASLLHVACVFGVPDWYRLLGAGVILKLPLLKTALVLITAMYLIRGVAGLIIPFLTSSQIVHQNSIQFWIISSIICCIYGSFYLFGTLKLWRIKNV